MSFSLTTEQIKNKTKTVTRRQGWAFLKVGDRIQPIEKGMGLKKGAKQKLIGLPILITKVTEEPINTITEDEVVKEGFPELSPSEFVEMYCKANKCKPTDLCRRIEFEYLFFRLKH
jgi:hypothetical protein